MTPLAERLVAALQQGAPMPLPVPASFCAAFDEEAQAAFLASCTACSAASLRRFAEACIKAHEAGRLPVLDEGMYELLASTPPGAAAAELSTYRLRGGRGAVALLNSRTFSDISQKVWPAAFVLGDAVEWLSEAAGPAVWADRRVVELGAGPGLGGLLALAHWAALPGDAQPASLCISDGDPRCLSTLVYNVSLAAGTSVAEEGGRDCPPGLSVGGCDSSRQRLWRRVGRVPTAAAMLRWGGGEAAEPVAFPEDDSDGPQSVEGSGTALPPAASFDVAIGSDLVYDPGDIPALVETVAVVVCGEAGSACNSRSSSRGEGGAAAWLASPTPRYGLLATTRRNPETFTALMAAFDASPGMACHDVTDAVTGSTVGRGGPMVALFPSVWAAAAAEAEEEARWAGAPCWDVRVLLIVPRSA